MITLTAFSSEHEIAKPLISKWATAEDRGQAELRRSAARQYDFLLARAALRALLAHVTDNDGWHIRPDAQGKPLALTATGMAGPHISLSHTQGLVACGVFLKGPFGIDVEYWRRRDFASLADYAFGPREREEVAHGGMGAFYRIWTLREAVSKATGKGLISAIDGHDCVAGAPVSGCWATESWGLFHTSPQADYSLAVASADKNGWSEASLVLIDLATSI